MGVLAIIAVIIAIVALARRSAKRDEERISARIREEREEEIKREKEAERIEKERQQQQRLEDAGLSESCLQFAQLMKAFPMILKEGEKLLQEAVSVLQKDLNDAVRNETNVYFSFSVDALGVRCDYPGSYAFTFASHGISFLESSEGMPVWAKTAGIGWALWRQIKEPLLNAVPALTIQSVDWSYGEYKNTMGSGTLRMKGVLKQDRFLEI